MNCRADRVLPALVWLAVVVAGTGVGARQGTSRASSRPSSVSTVREASCAADLGKGVKTGREFCDVIIAATGADSVSMSIPSHSGAATLYFDLHPRFETMDPDADPARLFQRDRPIVAVVGPTGDLIDRVATAGEFRATTDLFDRIAGGGPGGFKVVAPGFPSPIKVTLPAGTSAIGIVGLSLEITNRFNTAAYSEPGRPVAIVSNWRIDYVAR